MKPGSREIFLWCNLTTYAHASPHLQPPILPTALAAAWPTATSWGEASCCWEASLALT